MFVTNDDALYEHVFTLSNHGRSRKQAKQFWPDMIGYKYKMSNIQAAIGCAQMERIEELIRRKREIFQTYADSLLILPGVSMNPEKSDTVNGFWMPTVIFAKEAGIAREELQAVFATENIDARVFFWPLSCTGLFDTSHRCKNSQDIPTRSINLPAYHDMQFDTQKRVVSVINRMYAKPNGQAAYV